MIVFADDVDSRIVKTSEVFLIQITSLLALSSVFYCKRSFFIGITSLLALYSVPYSVPCSVPYSVPYSVCIAVLYLKYTTKLILVCCCAYLFFVFFSRLALFWLRRFVCSLMRISFFQIIFTSLTEDTIYYSCALHRYATLFAFGLFVCFSLAEPMMMMHDERCPWSYCTAGYYYIQPIAWTWKRFLCFCFCFCFLSVQIVHT